MTGQPIHSSTGNLGFDKPSTDWSIPNVCCIVMLVAAATLGPIIVNLILLGVAVWSVRSHLAAFQTLSMVALLRGLNSSLVEFDGISSLLFWVAMLTASASLVLRASNTSRHFWLLTSFCVVVSLTSILVSKAPDVSLTKAASFFIVCGSCLLGAASMPDKEVRQFWLWITSLSLVVVFGSAVILLFPSIAYPNALMGTRGILNHPQALSIFLVPFASVFLTEKFLTRRSRIDLFTIVVMLLLLILIYLTRARTAMLAIAVSLFCVVALHLFRSRRHTLLVTGNRIVGLVLVGLVGLGFFLTSDGGVNAIQQVVYKGDATNDSLAQAFAASRGEGIAAQLSTFLANPLLGIGFGVYEFGVIGGEASIVRVFGIPISAPAEKGFAFTAVLEETGILGGAICYTLVFAILNSCSRSSDPRVGALAFGSIFVNFGESVLFSPGGIGLFMWVCIALALARSRVDGN